MFLATLLLNNFKNFPELSVRFDRQITCIIGENGSGKTNLLDSIYYLSLGKSAFNPQDMQNIRHGQSFFSVAGELLLNGSKVSVQCALKKNQKKSLKVNGVVINKLSEHVGKYPLVLIAPDDSDLVKEHSDARRKFVDGILCQYSSEYLLKLSKYNNYLKQRNAALKILAEKRKHDETLIESYNKHLLELNGYLYANRKVFVEKFIPHLNSFYHQISGGREQIGLTYKSQVKAEDFEISFRSNLQRDLLLQRTELGIHRDDYIFRINSHGLKKFGSQGQQKSFIISLKLAQYEFLKEEKKVNPILLLDDIFDKLDDSRISKLIEVVNTSQFGQIFITDARERRTREVIRKNKIKAGFLCIADNAIKAC